MQEYFRQPIVDTFDIRICMAKSIKHSVDFLTAKETDLHVIGKAHVQIERYWFSERLHFERFFFNLNVLIFLKI